MKKKFVLGALCVSMILASGIGASAEVSESALVAGLNPTSHDTS